MDFLVQAKLRFRGLKPYLPPSIVGGQRLGLVLAEIERHSIQAADFDGLAIPFRAVAADIEDGEPVVLGGGSLAEALRASMAVPAVFAPVELDGRKLVDGGVVANLPVGIALDLGADRILAVDISSPLETDEDKLQSLFGVLGQTNSLLTVLNRREDVERLRPQDLLIVPALGDLSFSDFDRVAEAVTIGESAARADVDRLRPLADEAAWVALQARRATRPRTSPVIDAVKVENTSWVSDGVPRYQIRQPSGRPLDEKLLYQDAEHLSGLEYFGPIRNTVRTTPDGSNELWITTPKRPYGRNSLQFGVSLRDDFDTDASYTFAMRHLMLAVNRAGGEWVNTFQGGGTDVVSTQFYQPFGARMRWFVAPTLEYRNESRYLWVDAEPIAQIDLKRKGFRAEGGRVLGNWGELGVGAYASEFRVTTEVGSPLFSTIDERDNGVSATFRIDTVDSIQFPRHGGGVVLAYRKSLESLGSELEYRVLSLQGGYSWTLGRTTFFPYVEAGRNREDVFHVSSAFGLGGWLRLTGLGRDELIGSDMAFGRLAIYRELAKLDLGVLSQRVYAGAALEAGNAWLPGESVTWPSLRYGGAVFLGAETFLGPVFVGWGWTQPDRGRYYFLLGERF